MCRDSIKLAKNITYWAEDLFWKVSLKNQLCFFLLHTQGVWFNQFYFCFSLFCWLSASKLGSAERTISRIRIFYSLAYFDYFLTNGKKMFTWVNMEAFSRASATRILFLFLSTSKFGFWSQFPFSEFSTIFQSSFFHSSLVYSTVNFPIENSSRGTGIEDNCKKRISLCSSDWILVMFKTQTELAFVQLKGYFMGMFTTETSAGDGNIFRYCGHRTPSTSKCRGNILEIFHKGSV